MKAPARDPRKGDRRKRDLEVDVERRVKDRRRALLCFADGPRAAVSSEYYAG